MGTESFENTILLREWQSAEPAEMEFGFNFLKFSVIVHIFNIKKKFNSDV